MCSTGFEGLKNKTVVITGASSGIGAETAVYMGRIGCKLVITGRNETNLAATRQRCIEEAAVSEENVVSITADVCKADDCAAIIKKAIDSFGTIDVLVNSAGILVAGSLLDTSLEDYDRQMDGNVRSVFLMMKATIPHLLQSKGNIVNVSSVCGTRAFPGVCVYNMSKGALDQLTRSVALELASQGVRVNSVNPGVIVTDIHRRGGMTEEQYQKFLEHCKTTHALGRVGTADEVAASIAFLASPAASFITGCLLPVDGGRNVMCPR